ncbi:MAG TPA: glycosyltransferase family 1 protein [Longimicrobiaceae bacterium]
MRVVYFTESLYPLVDGVSRTLARLFDTLLLDRIDFRVISPFRPPAQVPWQDRVFVVPYLRFPPYPDYRVSRPGGRALESALEEFDPEIVHVVSPTPMAIWAQRYARRSAIPSVASFHTDFVSYFRYYRVRPLERFGWAALRWFYHRSDRIYAPTETVARELREQGIGPVELWSRGIDLDAYNPRHRDQELRGKLGVDDSLPLLLLVSRLVKEKDLADLVGIERELRARGVPFHLALVGDGPMREELEAALPDATFAGQQTGAELARWYASADVFVFPSTTETLGNVVLEALASGVPAVVVDRGGPQDLVRDGENGYVAPANDIVGISDRLERLLRDRTLRRSMGEAARRSASGRDWHTINRDLVSSYERLLRERAIAHRTGTGVEG